MNVYGFDIETNTLTLFDEDAELLCASVAQDYAISYVKDHPGRNNIDDRSNLFGLAVIGKLLSDEDTLLVGHNIQFDITGWERFYREDKEKERSSINCQIFDTMIANYLVDESIDGVNSLEVVTEKYLDKDQYKKLDFDATRAGESAITQLLFYNQVDSILVYKLYQPLMNEIVDKEYELLFSYLMDILDILIKMQIRGVRLDVKYIKEHRLKVENKIEDVHNTLTNALGDINFNSYQQLGEALYKDLQLPILETTKSGNPSTSKDAIVKLKNSPKVPNTIDDINVKDTLDTLVNYRKLRKINSTYLKPLVEDHLGYDKKIHTSYFLGKGYDKGITFGTVSGRTSSSNPNLQNIPNTRDIEEFTVNVRKGFVPTEGYKFYKADYSQLEMRVAAYLSKDSNMLGVFEKGIDIHTYSLSGVYDEDYDYIIEQLEKKDKTWKKRRLLIKNFNFALIYGASPWKLQMMLLKQLEIDMSMDEVREIVRKWNRLYPKFTEWRYLVHDIIRELGYVETETGRRRYFFNPEDRAKVEKRDMARYFREGLNDIIQSFGSDICLFGLKHLHSSLKENNCYPLLLVHDSIDGEMNPSISEKEFVSLCEESMIDYPKEILEQKFHLDVRNLYLDIEVDTHLDNWS